MKQKLEAKGWVMYYECGRCGGKQYFVNSAHPNYEVIAKPKIHTFRILLQSQVIAGPFAEYLLEEKLAQYVN